MRSLRWQILIAIGGLILVVGLLLGQTPSLQATSPQPVSGGAHVEALIGRPLRLNPLLDHASQVDRDVNRLLYTGLVRFDSQGNPTPDLADGWGVSADAKLYTLHLREDARWHDGQPVTAADVTYTFGKIQEDGFPGDQALHDFWSEINIILLDEHTVQFQLPEPFSPFLDFLAQGLLPDHLLRGVDSQTLIDHPFHLKPVGTGPFRFDRFLMEAGQIAGVNLEANADFYRQSPYLDRIEMRYFDSQEEAYEAYSDGAVQALGTAGAPILDQVLSDPNLNLHSARLPRVSLVYLNLKHPEMTFFSEKRLRQALMLAINRQALVDTYLGGQAIVATGPILPGNWAFATELEPTLFDPQQAAQLLDELEWELPAGAALGSPEYVRGKEDQTLAFELLHPDSELYGALARQIQTYWARVGVAVELREMGSERLGNLLEERDYQAALTEIHLSPVPDPDPYPLWHDSQAESGQNYAGFADRNSGIWLEQARITHDRAHRAQLYRSFQHRFQDQMPALLLFHPVYNYAISSELRGVTIGPIQDPSDRFDDVDQWFLLTRRNRAATAPVGSP